MLRGVRATTRCCRSVKISSRSAALQSPRSQCRVTVSLVPIANFRTSASSHPAWRTYAACTACIITGYVGVMALTQPHKLDSPSSAPSRKKKRPRTPFFVPVSPEGAEIMLHDQHKSAIFTRGGTVIRKDYAQIGGNLPCEDESSSEYIYIEPKSSSKSAKSRRLFTAIYDGHA